MTTTAVDLTRAVKRMAFEEGADLVGIASMSRYEGAPPTLRPRAHLPEAESVIVMAIHHPDASINFGGEPNSNYANGFQLGMIPKLDTMALRVARFVERHGHAAIPLSCTFYWRHRKREGDSFDHAASFSHMNAFVAAGLGEYGWHGMVMSPRYGPRQRLISVITAAPLVPDPLYDGEPLCDRCGQCEKACWGNNYPKEKRLSPDTIQFTIEDKTFEYANVNRWRCFWGEQCHLDMRELAKRDQLDEKGIYEAIDDGVARVTGTGGYMCASLKYCMSKPARRWDKKKAPNPLRKKPSPTTDETRLQKHIVHLAKQAGIDRISIAPLSTFEELKAKAPEGFRADDLFNSFKWVVTIGQALPEYLRSTGDPLSAKNNLPVRRMTTGRLTLASCDVARCLDDAGYEAWQTGGLFSFDQFASKASGWNDSGRPEIMTQTILCDTPLEPFDALLSGPFDDIESETALLDLSDERLPHVDLLGTVNLKDIPDEGKRDLLTLMPEARSLVVVGAELPRRVVELAGKQETNCGMSYQYVNYQAAREAYWAARDIASALKAKGHQAEPLFEIEAASIGQETPYVGVLPDLRAQAPFAAAAGLGFVGKSGFLISPKFGPRQRFAFALTSSELPTAAPVTGTCPESCRACVDACPAKALDASRTISPPLTGGDPIFERNEARCEWSRVLGMVEGGTLGGWRSPDLPVPDELDDRGRAEALASKDPIQTRCYENRPTNGDAQVERCLQACPFGMS